MIVPLLLSTASLLLPSGVRTAPSTRCTSPAMQFGGGAGKPPAAVMRCLTPAYEGAARGGEPFVAGTVAELTAIWKAMVKVYGSREKAEAACAKNSQVYLPYINTPECIIGAHGALVELFGAEGAAEIIRKNPGVLACNPKTLAQTSRGSIERAANFVDGFDSLPDGVKESLPFLTFVAIVGTVGTRLVQCGSEGATCAANNAEYFKGGLGPQLVDFVTSSLPSF